MPLFHVQKHPVAATHTPLPSLQMTIRRYRPISKKKYLKTFFEHGLFCHRLTEFDDKDDGVLENPMEDPNLRGALAAQSAHDADVASVDQFGEAFEDFHEDARYQHFASCWRMGNGEDEEIWEEYTDKDMVEGCAIETTVGGLMSILPIERVS